MDDGAGWCLCPMGHAYRYPLFGGPECPVCGLEYGVVTANLMRTFRQAVTATRADYNATRRWHLTRSSAARRKMSQTDGIRKHNLFALFRAFGLEDGALWSSERAAAQRRIMDAVDRCAGVDWSKVYESEEVTA